MLSTLSRHSRKRHHDKDERSDRASKRSFREERQAPSSSDQQNHQKEVDLIMQTVNQRAQLVKQQMGTRPGEEPKFKTAAIKPEEALIYADYHLTKQQKQEKIMELKRRMAESQALKNLQKNEAEQGKAGTSGK